VLLIAPHAWQAQWSEIMPEPATLALAVHICPEDELLLCCARTCVDAATAKRISRLLRADLDWAYVMRTALSHGVMPLLYWSLHTTCPAEVPEAFRNALRDRFYANAGRNLCLTAALLQILHLLEGHGIPAVPCKGPVLAAAVYGNLALRQFSDLDILVHDRDVLKAKDLLISQGYRPLRRRTSAEEELLLQSRHAYILVRNDGMFAVDLHWRFADRAFFSPVDLECLWEHLEPVSLAGTTVHHFAPEDLLLILCVNGSKDSWKQLRTICDIAELIRVHQGMAWERVMEQASTLGSERVLFLGLLLARDLLGTYLPKEILQRIQASSVVKSLAAHVHERLFREIEVDGWPAEVERFVFGLRLRERVRDRVWYCFCYVIPTSADRALLPWPAGLSFLLCLLRPIRLTVKYGPPILNYITTLLRISRLKLLKALQALRQIS